MNLREGRIGKQECASAAIIGATISGIFSVNTGGSFERGNSMYITSLLAALLALGVFLLAAAAMEKQRKTDLTDLYGFAFGRVLTPIVSFCTTTALMLAASLPIMRLLLILGRFVYVEAKVPTIALYTLPCVVVLAVMGLETIGRTARLFLVVIMLSILVTLLIAIPAYDSFRLYPLLGNGLEDLLQQSLPGTARFFPALCALLICGRGAQTLGNMRLGGKIAALGGGLLVSLCLFCLGMTYDYSELSKMHSPMFRLTMAVNTGSAYLRVDKLLLFFWLIGGLISSAFYVYAAALLHTNAFSMRDVRPTAAALSGGAVGVALFGHLNRPWVERSSVVLWEYLWIALLAPILLASILALLRKRKPA